MTINSSIILIVSDIEYQLNQLLATLPKHDTRVIQNEEDGKSEFQIIHAKKTIKEAYLSSSNTKYIILCGSTFRIEAQNALLKILEEPPSNIIFILITQSKNSILPTIFSRLQHKIIKKPTQIVECDLNLIKMDLKQIYDFLQKNKRISKSDAKALIESLLFKVQSQNIKLNQQQLDSFSLSIKLINLNSKPINVLTNILLNLMDTDKKNIG
ncbi:DNA poymerase III subunit delta' [hydrothermal vent metagenome]|uniref:DNA poymerase III subunit delta n=1 Tax=hydrothermal vent metagenome TaxID=652676 RepID=A0A3B1E9L8_9ZZZZ